MSRMLRLAQTHPVAHLQSYLGSWLRVKYTLYATCLVVITAFPDFAVSFGARRPYAQAALLFLMLTAWLPVLFRRSRFMWVVAYMTSLTDTAAVVYFCVNTGGVQAPPAITFPVLSLAFGLGFHGIFAYLPAVLSPVVATLIETGLRGEPGQILGTLWVVSLDALCVYAVGVYRRAEGLERDRYQRLSLADELTGLQNYRAFWMDVRLAFTRARRDARPLSIVLIDLDNFKQVNDRFGHIFGDSTLATVGRSLQQHIRKADRIYRYGGDEFAVMLPEEAEEPAAFVARKLTDVIGTVELYAVGTRVKLSASWGLRTYLPNREDLYSAEQLVDEADKALLQAKKSGLSRSNSVSAA